MHFEAIDIASSLVVEGVTVGMSLDPNGDVFYVLSVDIIDSKLKQEKINLVIPPTLTEGFIRVVNRMGVARD